MKVNRNQLSGFLEVLTLRGYDDEIKMRRLVNDIIIVVEENKFVAFGVDDTENILFNHEIDIEIEEEDDDPEQIVISDITKWIVYINSFKGTTISITESESTIKLESGNEFYNIPLEVEESIRSYIKSGGEPLLPYDGEGFYEVGDRDEWSEFKFNPPVFLRSITAGKNVENMNISLSIGKKVFAIEIGDINDPATPSFSNSQVEGIKNLTWQFKKNKLHTWGSEVGLHSIISTIDILDHAEDPSLFFKSSDKNLIIRSNNASIKGAPVRVSWAIAPPKVDDYDYQQDLEDLVED